MKIKDERPSSRSGCRLAWSRETRTRRWSTRDCLEEAPQTFQHIIFLVALNVDRYPGRQVVQTLACRAALTVSASACGPPAASGTTPDTSCSSYNLSFSSLSHLLIYWLPLSPPPLFSLHRPWGGCPWSPWIPASRLVRLPVGRTVYVQSSINSRADQCI